MAIDLSDDILQDFLLEAGEILELLGEQLVELERTPEDVNLLNAVFRGFHTVKGGAGFLNLTALVTVCHRAEDVFNLLRQGERSIDAAMMDIILRVVDVVNDMMDSIRSGVDPEEADPALIGGLEAILRGEAPGGAAPAPTPVVEEAPGIAPADEALSFGVDDLFEEPSAPPVPSAPAKVSASTGSGDEISDDEFEALLDELHGSPAKVAATPATAQQGDDITDEEFEALLDQLSGQEEAKPAPNRPVAATGAAPTSDEISDDEFEALLDELEEKKKTAAARTTPPAERPAAAPKAAAAPSPPPKVEPAPAVAAKEAPKPKPKVEPAPAPVADVKKPAAAPAKEAPAAETTVRVDTKRLDDIMNLVGELVLVRNRMATLKTTMADEEVAKAIANLDLVTSDLQTSVMKTRMQPIKKVFGRFPRVVRDLARSLKKEVELELYGEETDLDKNLVEALADPLVHLVRNAVDHGVEMPDEREAKGKPRTGRVILSAQQEGDHILLVIEDDGKGMNADVLRRSAVSKGVLDEESAARLDEKACYNLIFAPGFSTKTEISDVSGRGVGMDVVKTRITQLNGVVEVDSTEGKGSRIIIKLPLTLAIMPTLMVVLGKQFFAIPLANVSEIFDLDSAKLSTVDGKRVVIIREKAVPLVKLGKWLVNGHYQEQPAGQGYVVVTTIGNQHIGCLVDNLVGQEEVVIKPLGALLQGTKGISGATITGNGGIALILDMPGLMEAYGGRM